MQSPVRGRKLVEINFLLRKTATDGGEICGLSGEFQAWNFTSAGYAGESN